MLWLFGPISLRRWSNCSISKISMKFVARAGEIQYVMHPKSAFSDIIFSAHRCVFVLFRRYQLSPSDTFHLKMHLTLSRFFQSCLQSFDAHRMLNLSSNTNTKWITIAAGLHGGLLSPSILARPATQLLRVQRRGWTVHKQRDAQANLVARHVLR